MKTDELIDLRFNESIQVLTELSKTCQIDILEAATLLSRACLQNKKILVCGNGGSAADSQHFVAELVSAFSRDISRRPISAISLTVDTSIITAYSNDFGFENVFARQVEAHGNEGDVLVTISTSGESKNCIAAVEVAKKLGMKTIALTKVGSTLSAMCSASINVPSSNTQHIQESHVVVYHILSELIENSVVRGEQK